MAACFETGVGMDACCTAAVAVASAMPACSAAGASCGRDAWCTWDGVASGLPACFATGVGRKAGCGGAAVTAGMPACFATGVGRKAGCTGGAATIPGMPACFATGGVGRAAWCTGGAAVIPGMPACFATGDVGRDAWCTGEVAAGPGMAACLVTGVGMDACCTGADGVASGMPACFADGVGMDACCTGAAAVVSGMPGCFAAAVVDRVFRLSLSASSVFGPGCMHSCGTCCCLLASCTEGAAWIGPGGCASILAVWTGSGSGTSASWYGLVARSPEATCGSGPRKAHGMYGMPFGKPCPSSELILANGAGEATTCVSAMASS